jgi:hypothetical protein
MPIFTKTFAIIAGVLSVPVFTVAIIGGNYSSPFLTHLVDVIQGANTTTVVSNNAPNWAIGVPMYTPPITSSATSSYGSATSGLASSTTYTFAIAALDGTGTTTLSAPVTVTTDASTTQPYPEAVTLNWTPVNGATSYAIYFATSSKLTSPVQLFYATTSSQYTFATSTGSLYGPYTNTDTTAFSEYINPNGSDVFNDNLLVGTSTKAASTTAVHINGDAVIVAPATTTACESDTAGAIFFNTANSHEWGCNGSTWTKIF